MPCPPTYMYVRNDFGLIWIVLDRSENDFLALNFAFYPWPIQFGPVQNDMDQTKNGLDQKKHKAKMYNSLQNGSVFLFRIHNQHAIIKLGEKKDKVVIKPVEKDCRILVNLYKYTFFF